MNNINSNIKKRETFTTFDHIGRRFIINSFNPLIGNYILIQCITFVLPFGIGKLLAQSLGGTEVESKIGTSAKIMSKEDFIQFQQDILETVEEEYESGQRSPVMRGNGTFGISDVSSMLIIKLLIASLAFNFKDFFEELPSIDGLTKALDLNFAT